MKNLVLAAATVFAIGSGTALADGNVPNGDVNAQPAPASQPAQAVQKDTYVYGTNGRTETWIYPAFNRPGWTQGGDR